MYRFRLSDPYTPWGQYRYGSDEGWHGPQVRRELAPKGGEDEVCLTCFKPSVAREHCGTCGDVLEEDAA